MGSTHPKRSSLVAPDVRVAEGALVSDSRWSTTREGYKCRFEQNKTSGKWRVTFRVEKPHPWANIYPDNISLQHHITLIVRDGGGSLELSFEDANLEDLLFDLATLSQLAFKAHLGHNLTAHL